MTSLSPFVWQRRVALSDVDAFQVVWYGTYLKYCDEAAAELMRAFDLAPQRLLEAGYAAAVVEAHCQYARPSLHDELIEVSVRVSTDKSAFLKLDFEIHGQGDRTLRARIQTTLVLRHREAGLLYFIPEPIAVAVAAMVRAQPHGAST